MFVIYNTTTNEIYSWSNVSMTAPSGCAEIETNNYINEQHKYYDASTDTFFGPTETEKNEIDLQLLRLERDDLLAQSDWTQVADSPLTDAKKAEWVIYRQALRDLPSTTTDFANPVWPSQPS